MNTVGKSRFRSGFMLGALAPLLLAGCGPTAVESVSMVEVAQAAAREEDRVDVHELATWLIQGRRDFFLVDVRDPDEYAAGAIEGASNIPIARLVTPDSIADLPAERRVVVYSNGSENAAKAVVMLRLSGLSAQLLVGGYKAWQSRILNPDIPAEAMDGESLQVAEQRAYACYFVGECPGAAALPERADAEPFVPPVFVESAEDEPMPPPPAEEGC